MQIVDGNAVAGALHGMFRADPTMLIVACGHCGTAGPLAGTVVEQDDYAAIVRCRTCTRTLLTVFEEDDGVAVTVASLARITLPAASIAESELR